MIAVIIALVLWSHPAPTLYVCAPGQTPSSPTSCEQLHFHVLGKFPIG